MSDMEDTPEASSLMGRIEQRLADLGMTESAVSIAAFGHHKAIAQLRTATKSPGLEKIRALAKALQVSPSWLAWGAGDAQPPAPQAQARPQSLRYLGEVAAGQWLSQDVHVDAAPIRTPGLSANPRWPAAAQYVVRVRGTSINRIAPDGAFLSCVDPRSIRYTAQDGDLVIVERRRFGGSEIERTAKRFHREDEEISLWPDSSDPQHKPIRFDPGGDDGDTEVEIVGIADRFLQTIEPGHPWERGEPE